MSSRALNPQQFFHGTNQFLNEGDEIHPAAVVGHNNYPRYYAQEPHRAQHTYATNNESAAWSWAADASSPNYSQKPEGWAPETHSRVYEVEPTGSRMYRDKEGTGVYADDKAYMTKGPLKIKRRIETMPPMPHSRGRENGVQGRFFGMGSLPKLGPPGREQGWKPQDAAADIRREQQKAADRLRVPSDNHPTLPFTKD